MHALAPTKMTAFRLDQAILDRLDRHAARLTAASNVPGAVYNRTDALRALVLAGLEAAEAVEVATPDLDAKKPSKKRRPK